METEISLGHLQQPATCPCAERNQSNPWNLHIEVFFFRMEVKVKYSPGILSTALCIGDVT